MTAPASPNDPATEKIWAHVLAGSAAIAGTTDYVTRVLHQALGAMIGRNFEIGVSPVNGWIDAIDHSQVWGTRVPVLPTAMEAEARARRFLLDLAHRLRPGSEVPLIYVPPLSPRPLELVVAPHPYRGHWDHWIYRTQPRLPAGGKAGALAVFGTHIEVRIGTGGRIVGFHSQWRPTTGERMAAPATPYTPANHEERDHHDTPSIAPARVYVLEGAIIPQLYLAAYHLVNNGHHLAIESACSLALTVAFAVDEAADATIVRAVVRGGSGNYAFAWARAATDDPFAHGIEPLGAGTSERAKDGVAIGEVRVTKGAAIVMVNVVDRATGAFKHHQQLVYSAPFDQRVTPFVAVPDPTLPIMGPAVDSANHIS